MRYSLKLSALMFACALAVLAWSCVVHLWRRSRSRRFCPGPHRSIFSSLLNPWCWIIAPRCGYNLSGLPASNSGCITCPECGRHIRSLAHAPVHTNRLRVLRIALAMIAALWVVGLTDFVRRGTWAERAPDWAVVANRLLLGQHGSRLLLRQADERIDSGSLSIQHVRWLMPSYVNDLRDDDIRWNADRAISIMSRWGSVAIPELEKALRSRDYQQRQLAAHTLREIFDRVPSVYRPSDALLAVTVEGLRSDTLPYQPAEFAHDHSYHYLGINNAREGMAFLAQFPERAAPLLKQTMHTGDEQARTLAAGIACFAQITDLLPEAVPLLASHLRDNSIALDATFAAAALYRAGPLALPYLDLTAPGSDNQERVVISLIVWESLHEPDDRSDVRRLLEFLSPRYKTAIRVGEWDDTVPIPDWPIRRGSSHVALER